MTVELNYETSQDLSQRGALKELIVLSLPTVAQMMSYTVLQFTDTYMLSLAGPAEATAAGTAGMFAFSFIGFGMGMLTLVNTLVSQAYGRKEFGACGHYLWQGIWFGVLYSLLILPTVWVGRWPFQWSGHEPALVEMEVTYYQILIVGGVFKMLSTTYGQFIADILAWTLFLMTVMAIYGTDTMAANIYAFRFWHVSFMPAFGLSAAVTALVGRYIGMGRPDISAKRANLGFVVAAAYMTACGAVFFAFGRQMMRLFTDDPEIMRIGGIVLAFAAIYQFFDAMYIIYNGALRGAGDTLVPSLAVLIGSWLFVVGGAYVVSRQFPQWGPAGPWAVTTVYGMLLGMFLFARFRRGRWKSIRLHGHVDSNLALTSDKVLALD